MDFPPAGHRPRIILLIGPKGSGKSLIGTLMADHSAFVFVRVETWALDVRRDRPADDPEYVSDVFARIEAGLRETLQQTPGVVFESTGLTDAFDQMLTRLQADFQVALIGIRASDVVCLERIRTRDASIHIPVSDHLIADINRQVREKQIPVDLEIVNEGKELSELTAKIRQVLRRIAPEWVHPGGER